MSAEPAARDRILDSAYAAPVRAPRCPRRRVPRASADHLESIRTVLRSPAEEVGLSDSEKFARFFHILMKGSIVQAGEGDVEAAKRAQATGGGSDREVPLQTLLRRDSQLPQGG